MSVSASDIKRTMKTKVVMIGNHEVLVQILNVITFLVLSKSDSGGIQYSDKLLLPLIGGLTWKTIPAVLES